MRVRTAPPEFLAFILLFFALSILVPPLLAVPGAPVWAVLFIELLVFNVALDLSEPIAAVFVGERDLARLNHLGEPPPVAVVFLVCDDLSRPALARLGGGGYPRADVFILDDSRDPHTRRTLDDAGFCVVRRPRRRGAKAGSLNNWLGRHGRHYKYFLVLDSDSIIAEGFLDSLVRYAEHPANARVAIFNTLPRCWNTQRRFPRLLSALTPLQNWIRMCLANRSPCVLSTGHNNLHRTGAILEVGGFDEEFVAEDIAVTLKLVRAGYTSRLVNLLAFEAEPENIFSYVRRLLRWAKQNVQIQRADWRDTPFPLKFQMFRLTWWYASFFLYPAWLVLAAWGASSSPADAGTVFSLVFREGAAAVTLFAPFAVAALFPLTPWLLRIPLVGGRGISLRDYAGNCLLSVALHFYAMLAVCGALVAAATAEAVAFSVTDKSERPVTLRAVLLFHWHLAPFWLFLALGFAQNVLGLALLFPWLLMVLCAPLLVYFFHQPRGRHESA